MPLLYGSDVTLESPDPMSKYHSANQTTSNLQKVAHKNTRISVLLQNCKDDVTDDGCAVPRLDLKGIETMKTIRSEASKYMANISPDAVTDDIYDFDTKKDKPNYKQAVDSCKYPMNRDTLKFESSPPLQRMSEDEEQQLTARVHAVKHKSVRIMEKKLTRRSLSPSLNTLERQLQHSDALSSAKSPHMMPASRSLDTLHPHTPNSVEEKQVLHTTFKPTPPSRGPQGMRVTFTRRSPQPPSTLSPKMQSMATDQQSNMVATPPSANKENVEANIRQSRGRRYTNPVSPVVEETKEDITSPTVPIAERPLPTRPTSNARRRRPQPSPPKNATTVEVEYCIKSPERSQNNNSKAAGMASPLRATDIPHPSPKRVKGDRTVTVSGLSKQLLVSLITAASKKRRRRNKHQPAFCMKLEHIPEDDFVELTFPSWIACAVAEEKSPSLCIERVAEKSPARVFAEREYVEWLRSQVVIKALGDDEEEELDSVSSQMESLMRSIQDQDTEKFKFLLNENKNLIYCRDQDGNTALVAATLFGWKRGIKTLIKRGADLDAQNRFGNTSLHYASAIEEHHEIKRYLIRKQASSSIRNERGICSCDSIQ